MTNLSGENRILDKTKVIGFGIKSITLVILICSCLALLGGCTRLTVKYQGYILRNETLEIKLEEVMGASYRLEYKYIEFDKEYTAIDSDNNIFLIPRKRGQLWIVGTSKVGARTAKTEIIKETIVAKELELPSSITVSKESNHIKISWLPSYYNIGTTSIKVPYYQLKISFDSGLTFEEFILSYEETKTHQFFITSDIVIKVRPLNYSYFEGQTIKEPKELFEMYTVSESYASLSWKYD